MLVEPIRDKRKIEKIKSILRDRPRDYALFVLGINFALRIGDLLSLRVKDVRHPDGSLRDDFIIVEQKTGHRRQVIITSQSKKVLESYFAAVNLSQDAPLFPGRSGKALSRSQAWRLMKKWAMMAGLDGNYGTHTFRKTFGYQGWKNKCPIEAIQETFGHSNPSITRKYICVSRQDVRHVYEAASI